MKTELSIKDLAIILRIVDQSIMDMEVEANSLRYAVNESRLKGIRESTQYKDLIHIRESLESIKVVINNELILDLENENKGK